MELKGKAAIVTGGTRGIGRAVALMLAKEGCDVAINYRKSDKEARSLVKEIKAMGREAIAVKADVSSYSDAEKMFEKAKKKFGRLDILVNNAGINWDGVIWKMSEKQFDSVIATNLKGCFNYSKLAAIHFKDQRNGKIVNISSINGLRGKFGQINYTASKGGEIAMTKSLARELGKFNINVNCICPGMVMTEMARNIPQEFLDKAVDETVLGRIAEPEEIASVVVFLCSESSRHITGEIIKVDGGQYI